MDETARDEHNARMNDVRWAEVDRYIDGRLVDQDDALADALERSAAAGLPAIHVAPNQGKLLQLLSRSVQARAILEVGTLGGYSTIWLARAVADRGIPGSKLRPAIGLDVELQPVAVAVAIDLRDRETLGPHARKGV